jgi:monooxygenase
MREHGLTECVAHNDAGASAEDVPLLGLTSGYIQRSAHLLPKQGKEYPWRVHQSYFRDYRALRMSDVEDSIMEFSTAGSHPDAGADEGTDAAVAVAS